MRWLTAVLAGRLDGRVVAASLGLLAWLSDARAVSADWLVTRGGQVIETVGPWRIEGRQVVFESRTVPLVGRVPSSDPPRFTVSVDEIDLPRSVAETEAHSGVRREDLSRSILDVATFPRMPLQGRENWEYPSRSPHRAELVLTMGGSAWDNFLQRSARDEAQEVVAGVSEARLTWRMSGGVKGYLEGGHLRYDSVTASTAFGGGLRVDGSRHGFQLGARLEPNRRSPELNDDGDASDMRGYKAQYFGQGGPLRWLLAGERLEQRFDALASRDSTVQGLRTTILYRAFNGKLAPEVGFGWWARDASRANDDERQRTLMAGIHSRPLRPLELSIRFEHTQRRFVVTDGSARNFGREDVRRRWTFEVDGNLSRQLALGVMYARLDGDSNRSGRQFSSQNVAAGLTVRLGSTRRPGDRRRRGEPPAKPMPDRRSVATGPLPPAPPQPPPPPAALAGESVADAVEAPSGDSAPPAPEAVNALPRDSAPPEPEAVTRPAAGPPAAPQPIRVASRLLELQTRSVADETTVVLRGDGELRYSTFTLTAPHRLVVDLLDVFVGRPRTEAVSSDLVIRVRVAQFRPGARPIGRIVIDLERPAVVDVEARDGSLQLRLRRSRDDENPTVTRVRVDSSNQNR